MARIVNRCPVCNQTYDPVDGHTFAQCVASRPEYAGHEKRFAQLEKDVKYLQDMIFPAMRYGLQFHTGAIRYYTRTEALAMLQDAAELVKGMERDAKIDISISIQSPKVSE